MHFYTCQPIHNIIPEPILEVPYAYTATNKNIYNSALYLIRQIALAYDQYKRLDPQLNSNISPVETLICTKELNNYIPKPVPLVQPNPESIINTLGGKRQSRGTYVNDSVNNNSNKKLVVHADINGSYNIMRKVFKNMKYNKDRHNLNYRIACVQSNKKHVMAKLIF